MADQSEKQESFCWPLRIRIIHWSLALAIVFAMFVFVEGDWPHKTLGYIALAATLIRGWLGLRGRSYELFRNFPLSPRDFKLFIKNYFDPSHIYAGHNPAASLVYLLMWISVALLAVTGWMMGLDAFWGNQTLEDLHEGISNFLLVLILGHFIGMGMDAYIHKRKTWMKMIRGS